MSKKKNELVSMTQDDFTKAVTPKPPTDEMFFFKCPECGNLHFRHAGYMETLMPFIRASGEKKVCAESYQVKVCTKCKKCFIWYCEQMYDVTDKIDLKAWTKTEKEMQEATGPGGNC